MFAAKPAPVQASWIGYPLTTGLQAIDYYLSDPYFTPPDELDSQFTEKLMLLPACVPFLPSEFAPAIEPAPVLANGYITFGSFNRSNKINRQVIARWCHAAARASRFQDDRSPPCRSRKRQHNWLHWFAEEGIAPRATDL